MKKISLYIIALTCALCACSRDEKNLFDKSAAERSAFALQNAIDVLTGSENGWEMVYFANRTSRGYNMVVKFRKDGQMIATTQNDLTTNNKVVTDSTSTWKIVNDCAPLLSFDTYNDVLHAWADPQEDGDGFLGDYEFIILDVKNDRVVLKGKKHSAYSVLTRADGSRTPEEYFKKSREMESKLMGNQNILTASINGKQYNLYNYSQDPGILYASTSSELVVEDCTLYPYCGTPEGLVLSFGFSDIDNPLHDEKWNERIYTFDGANLVGEIGSYLQAPNMKKYLPLYMTNIGGWTIQPEGNSANINGYVDRINATLKNLAGSKAAFKGLRLRYVMFYDPLTDVYTYKMYAGFQYSLTGKQESDINYVFDINFNENDVTFSYIAPLDGAGGSGEQMLNIIDGLKDLVYSLNGTFAAETSNVVNPTLGSVLKNVNNAETFYAIKGTLR